MEKYREVGRQVKRVDARDKVTGRAMFTDDLCPKPCLVAKILHSTIGNGRVVSIDTSEALEVPGVVAVFTCFDVPDIAYPVAGHPWYADSAAAKRDQADRKLLDDRVRIYGDNIAVVVGEDTVACDRALRKIHVEYEEYPVVYDALESMKGTEVPVQERKPDNIAAHSCAITPDDKLAEAGYKTVDEALAVTNRQVVDALGGLPAHKLHCSVLAEESIKSAVKDYYDRSGIAYDRSKFPEDCGSCESCRMV